MLEQEEGEPGLAQRDLVPRASHRRVSQALVFLAPPTDLDRTHVRFAVVPILRFLVIYDVIEKMIAITCWRSSYQAYQLPVVLSARALMEYRVEDSGSTESVSPLVTQRSRGIRTISYDKHHR